MKRVTWKFTWPCTLRSVSDKSSFTGTGIGAVSVVAVGIDVTHPNGSTTLISISWQVLQYRNEIKMRATGCRIVQIKIS